MNLKEQLRIENRIHRTTGFCVGVEKIPFNILDLDLFSARLLDLDSISWYGSKDP